MSPIENKKRRKPTSFLLFPCHNLAFLSYTIVVIPMKQNQQTIMRLILFILITLFLTSDTKSKQFYQNIKLVKDPTSYLVLVNKFYRLKDDYIPTDLEKISLTYANNYKYLRHQARIQFEALSRDAKKQDLEVVAVSAFRSYKYQEQLYESYIEEKGIEYADNCSARPGHSEHQAGLSVDVMGSNHDYDRFEEAKEFRWVKENAHKYGFILRYPKGKERITGFKYEPWHYRYVGIKAANEIKKRDITLEEYLEQE